MPPRSIKQQAHAKRISKATWNQGEGRKGSMSVIKEPYRKAMMDGVGGVDAEFDHVTEE